MLQTLLICTLKQTWTKRLVHFDGCTNDRVRDRFTLEKPLPIPNLVHPIPPIRLRDLRASAVNHLALHSHVPPQYQHAPFALESTHG